VHGCISESNAFFIPGDDFLDDFQTPEEARKRGIDLKGKVSLKEWIELLNSWSQSQMYAKGERIFFFFGRWFSFGWLVVATA
jgi:hypothetical protein